MKLVSWITALFTYLWGLVRPPKSRPHLEGLVTRRYVDAACQFAERVSQVSVYSQLEVESALLEWENAEFDYVNRGLRSLPLADFIDYVSWNVPLRNVGKRRSEGEMPMLHARYYRYFTLRRKGLHELVTLVQGERRQHYDS